MKKSSRTCLILGLAAGVVGATQTDFKLPPETARFKPGPGAELATAQCQICHSADYIATQPRLSRAAWQATVKKMREKYGAPIPVDQDPALVDYLAKTYGAENPPASKPDAAPAPKRTD
jgi:mono/diheme cytochrome c family protein